MGNLANRLHALGGLKDAIVRGLRWRVEANEFEIEIEDLNEGFRGLDGYPGAPPGRIVCTGVTRLEQQVEPSLNGLRIFDISVDYEGTARLRLEVGFYPGGKLVVESAQIELRAN